MRNAPMSGLTAASDRTYSRLRILLSVYFLICVLWFVVSTAHWKLVNDAAQIHYVCFLMDHGMAPYRDILEVNWPGTYLVNWAVMHTLGAGAPAWRIFDLALMGMSCWAMVAIARPYDWFAGVFGAALFILYHGRDGAGQEGQRDLIIAVLLLCAYAFLFASFRSRRLWPLLAFGVCAGVAATIKPTPLPFAFLLLVVAVIRLKRDGEPILKPTLYMLLGLLIPFAVVGAFLISEGSLASFWYLLHRGCPFTTRLEVLLSDAHASDRNPVSADAGAYRIGDCCDRARLVELGRQIAHRRNPLRHSVVLGARKELPLSPLSDAGISLSVGGAGDGHCSAGPANRWRAGNDWHCLRCHPCTHLRETVHSQGVECGIY